MFIKQIFYMNIFFEKNVFGQKQKNPIFGQKKFG